MDSGPPRRAQPISPQAARLKSRDERRRDARAGSARNYAIAAMNYHQYDNSN
jgi:hypothetical protein